MKTLHRTGWQVGKLAVWVVKWKIAGIFEEKVEGSGTIPITGWFY